MVKQSLGSSGLETGGSCQAWRLTECPAEQLSGCCRGPEGCIVEPSLGGSSLSISGQAWLRLWYEVSGWSTLSVSDIKPCGCCVAPSTKKADRKGPLNTPPSHSFLLLHQPLHLPHNTQTHGIVEPSTTTMIALHLLLQTSLAQGGARARPQHWRGYKPGWCLSSLDSIVQYSTYNRRLLDINVTKCMSFSSWWVTEAWILLRPVYTLCPLHRKVHH